MYVLVSSSFEFISGDLERIKSLCLHDSIRRGYSGFGVPQTVIIIFILTDKNSVKYNRGHVFFE